MVYEQCSKSRHILKCCSSHVKHLRVACCLGASLDIEQSLNLDKVHEAGSRFATSTKESWKCGFILHFNHAAFQNKEHFKDCKLQE